MLSGELSCTWTGLVLSQLQPAGKRHRCYLSVVRVIKLRRVTWLSSGLKGEMPSFLEFLLT